VNGVACFEEIWGITGVQDQEEYPHAVVLNVQPLAPRCLRVTVPRRSARTAIDPSASEERSLQLGGREADTPSTPFTLGNTTHGLLWALGKGAEHVIRIKLHQMQALLAAALLDLCCAATQKESFFLA
jgi:hypothetical protein